MPLTEAGPPSGRRWNPWDNPFFLAVDTAGIGPLTVGYGDSDDPGLPPSGAGSRP